MHTKNTKMSNLSEKILKMTDRIRSDQNRQNRNERGELPTPHILHTD
jgi:hypothetical protein